jgi:hypothetical protein
MTKAKCSEPTVAMVKLGDGDWTPSCEKHVAAARAKSAKAGKESSPQRTHEGAGRSVPWHQCRRQAASSRACSDRNRTRDGTAVSRFLTGRVAR